MLANVRKRSQILRSLFPSRARPGPTRHVRAMLGGKMGQDGFKIVQDVSWKRLKTLYNFNIIFIEFWKVFGVPLGTHFWKKKIILGYFWGYTSWSPILYRFWQQILMFFFIVFWLLFGSVFYMCCVSSRLRECTFYRGKTWVREK